MQLGIVYCTGLLCSIWDIFMPLLWKGIFKKDFCVFSCMVFVLILCKPSLKLAKSLIMSGMCLGMFCSKSRLFARFIIMPSFLCSKLKTRFESSWTNPGLLQILSKPLSLCSISVHVFPCCRLRLCGRFLNFRCLLLKSDQTTMFSVPFLEIIPTFLTLPFSPYGYIVANSLLPRCLWVRASLITRSIAVRSCNNAVKECSAKKQSRQNITDGKHCTDSRLWHCDVVYLRWCWVCGASFSKFEFGHHDCAHGQALLAWPPPFYTPPSLIAIRERNAYVTHIYSTHARLTGHTCILLPGNPSSHT